MRWVQCGAGLFRHEVETNLGGEFDGLKAAIGHVDDREVRIDTIHDPGCREGVGTGLDEFGGAIPGGVLCDHEYRLHAGNEIHRPPDRGYGIRRTC